MVLASRILLRSNLLKVSQNLLKNNVSSVESLKYFSVSSINQAEIKENYKVESYSIQTKDGYILRLCRIPNPNSTKPPVFLQHGILNTSDIFLLGDHKNGLPYLLSKEGYDVWLGNTRGNRYCRKHVSLSPDQKEFWNYNLQEIAVYDIRESLDFVLKTTSQKDLHYIGHSQGTTVSFILMSEVPESNSILRSATMLAPVVFMGGLATRKRNFVDTFSYSILAKTLAGDSMRNKGSFELLPHNEKLAEQMKSFSVKYERFFKDFYDAAGFIGKEHFNAKVLPKLFSAVPAGASMNQLIHYAQMVHSGKFRQFDWGESGNMEKYGSPEPPEYNLGNVKAPINLFFSDVDGVLHYPDVFKLIEKLENVNFVKFIENENYQHLDFLTGLRVNDFVNNDIVDLLNITS